MIQSEIFRLYANKNTQTVSMLQSLLPCHIHFLISIFCNSNDLFYLIMFIIYKHIIIFKRYYCIRKSFFIRHIPSSVEVL